MGNYSLGSGEEEQWRLLVQREIYGDTEGIVFNSSDSVVEFGCGPGANLWIAQAVSKGRYLGLDIQPAQVEHAKMLATQIGLQNTAFEVVDGSKTGLKDAEFDVAFCRCLLIHLSDPKAVLKEMFRVTKPGGRIIVIEPHDSSYYVGPDKPALSKCLKARTEFVYSDGKGSPDVGPNLFRLLSELPALGSEIRVHLISEEGEKSNIQLFLENLVGMIAPVSAELVNAGLITAEDWERAQAESKAVSPQTLVTQMLWVSESRKLA